MASMEPDEPEVAMPDSIRQIDTSFKRIAPLHEVGAGAPCLKCGDRCPGLDLHFWRKICRNCKCGQAEHDIKPEFNEQQRRIGRLFGEEVIAPFQMTTMTIERPIDPKSPKAPKETVTFEWVPGNVTTSLAQRYMEMIPAENQPIAGTVGAQQRDQQMMKQLPSHDQAAEFCDDLTEHETKKLEEFVSEYKAKALGVGLVREVIIQDMAPHVSTARSHDAGIGVHGTAVPLAGQRRSPSPGGSAAYPAPASANVIHGSVGPGGVARSEAVPSGVRYKTELLHYQQEGGAGHGGAYHPPGMAGDGHGVVYQPGMEGSMGREGVERGTANVHGLATGHGLATTHGDISGTAAEHGYADATPGQAGVAAGHAGFVPGQAGVASGYAGVAPGQAGFVPGQAGVASGYAGVAPGQAGFVPGQAGVASGYAGVAPGQAGFVPGQAGVGSGYAGATPGYAGEGVAPAYPGVATAHTGIAPGHAGISSSHVGGVPGHAVEGMAPGYAGGEHGTPGHRYEGVASGQAGTYASGDGDRLGRGGDFTADMLDAMPPPPPPGSSVGGLGGDMGQQAVAPQWKCCGCHENLEGGDVAVFAERAGPDKCWHPGCFRCGTCNELLVDLIYFYKDDKVYCGRHYADLHRPRCAACDELIFAREYTQAEDQNWHLKHFCCFECDTLLGGKRYVPRDNHPYCLECYEVIFAKICQACKGKISADAQRLSHKEFHWHANEQCFCCSNCNTNLLGKQFLPKAGHIFCSVKCKKEVLS
uniref:Testin-like n=1 Tax=Saccoglossus kowalevskii TaxID=10224 RepID=A0ABM0GPS9_SACKO|nr:PREDICTED: testin-like [Saccoglossus kowalevskii]